jgi:hypothetical protein
MPAVIRATPAVGLGQFAQAANVASLPAAATALWGQASMGIGNKVQRDTISNYPRFGNEDKPSKFNTLAPDSREGMARRAEVMGISASAPEAWRTKEPWPTSKHEVYVPKTAPAIPEKPEVPKAPVAPPPVPPAAGGLPKMNIPQIQMPELPANRRMTLEDALGAGGSMKEGMGGVLAKIMTTQAAYDDAAAQDDRGLETWKTQTQALPNYANANVNAKELGLKQQQAPSEIALRDAQSKKLFAEIGQMPDELLLKMLHGLGGSGAGGMGGSAGLDYPKYTDSISKLMAQKSMLTDPNDIKRIDEYIFNLEKQMKQTGAKGALPPSPTLKK